MRRLLAKWVARWLPREEPSPKFIEVPTHEMTVEQWRADREYVASAARVLNDPQTRLLLRCVENSSPAYDVLPLGTQTHDRIVQQARAEGYTMALATLRSLGRERQFIERVEATFESDTSEPSRGAA